MPEFHKTNDMMFPPVEELQTVWIGDRRLHVFVPDAARVRAAWNEGERRGGDAFPYWSKIWPASLALCQWLNEHPSLYAGKKLLEMGAGLGLPSLFVAPGAEWVLCTDKDQEALVYARASAIHNRYHNMVCRQVNWMEFRELVACDLLLMSDVNYEPSVFEGLRRTIEAYFAQGTEIVLSTPQRLAAREFVSWLEPYVRSVAVEEAGGQPVSVCHLSG
jgi:predicted nicotinamide N-methyase